MTYLLAPTRNVTDRQSIRKPHRQVSTRTIRQYAGRALSGKLLETGGITHISETDTAEMAAHNISVRYLMPSEGTHPPKASRPDDNTWALVEHIVEDAIEVMEDAIQYVGQTSKKLILFSLNRSYRRIRSIRDRRGIYATEYGSDQNCVDNKGRPEK